MSIFKGAGVAIITPFHVDISRSIQLRISDSTETDIEILRQYCIQDTQI